MKKLTTLLLALLPWLALAQVANSRILFVSNLNSQQEAPPVNNNARGVVSFLVSDDLGFLRIHGVFNGLSGPITGCSLHTGAEATSGPVFLDLSSQIEGNTLRADIPMPAGFMSKALREQLYLNVSTAANPSGEIRGQLFIKSDVIYGTALDGLAEVPAVNGAASGIIKFTYSPGQTKGQYFAVVDGLSGPITSADIHDAAAGANGPVYAPLTVASANTLVGEFVFTNYPDFLGKLENEGFYVNIKTAAHPSGEVRGQLHSPGPFCFDAILNGDQETPPVASAAGGTAVATLTANLDTLVFKATFHGLTPTAVNFCRGAAGASGPVILPLTQSSYPNFFAGRVPVSADVARDFIRGDVYVNILTASHPDGEIRGQMQPMLRTVYAFDLCGEQEVPSNNSTAEGTAIISMSRFNTHLDYLYTTTGLSGAATVAHIHTGAPGAFGPVYAPVFAPAPVGSGQFEIDGAFFTTLESGNTYLNIYTPDYPNGEIRGQIGRALACSDNVPVAEPLLSGAVLSPNPAADAAELRFTTRDAFAGQLLIRNTAGQAVLIKNLDLSAGEQIVPVDLSRLLAGLYLIEIRSQAGNTAAAFKLIRQ